MGVPVWAAGSSEVLSYFRTFVLSKVLSYLRTKVERVVYRVLCVISDYKEIEL